MSVAELSIKRDILGEARIGFRCIEGGEGMEDSIRVKITCSPDIVAARQQGRSMAARLGFSGSDLTIIATAISEVARNIVEHAKKGEIILKAVEGNSRHGIVIIAQDEGPGIADVTRALQDGFSTGEGMGLGLPGAKRLMDTFEIVSRIGQGTTIIMKKWMRGAKFQNSLQNNSLESGRR
jgi:serine/threonine-protein kinase RsbT